MDLPKLPETVFVVIHWRGNIPIRVQRLDNPTAAELLREQQCYTYGGHFVPTVQTLMGDEATRLYAMMGSALVASNVATTGDAVAVAGRSITPAATSGALVPWQELNVFTGQQVFAKATPGAREALSTFREQGVEQSGILAAHKSREPRNGKYFVPDEIDWTGFDD